jgi:hypothetical protein
MTRDKRIKMHNTMESSLTSIVGVEFQHGECEIVDIYTRLLAGSVLIAD